MSTETVKTVAWLWWDANATGIDTGGKHGRYKVSDLCPPDIRAFAVVARSDLESAEARAQQLAKENDFLRALTGNSDKACVYCGLGADEQGKCTNGFPGCARGDDQMLCREVGVGLERDAANARAQQLAKALEKAKAMPMKYRRMEFNAKLQEEASAANTRAERAEQALRESQENASRLFMACMNILYGIDNHLSITSEIARMREVTTMHSLQAAARAIVDGEQT